MTSVLDRVQSILGPHGFRSISPNRVKSACTGYLKRQSLNMNRAVAVVHVERLPDDVWPLLSRIKKEAAFSCGFFPFLYGLGTQLIIVEGGSESRPIDLRMYVDKVDNQWSILQSIFLLDARHELIASARTWGQVLTGKYQDMIEAEFSRPNVKSA